jgi:serine/threonine protein kinase
MREAMAAAHGTSDIDRSPVPGYEILRILNQGGMGRIFLARQHALNRVVCVKTLSIPVGQDADLYRARFCREAELLASVSHPHILSIFDFGTTADQGLPFLVTEYIEGGDLRTRMKPGHPMRVHQARSILVQVADALSYLHGKGIYHRDLKPENILMLTESLVKLGDFGIAVMRDQAGMLTESLLGLGTLGYVSPEQQYGLKLDERSDEYSLAALSYELLTGRRPLGSFAPPSQLSPPLALALDAVILRGLAEEPKHRFATVRDYIQAFDQALLAQPNRRQFSRRAWAVLTTGALVLAVGSWLLFSAWRPQKNSKVKAGATASAALASQGVPAKDEGQTSEAGIDTVVRSAEYQRLIKLRAYSIWVHSGRPTGLAGESARHQNWSEAQKQIESEIKERAFNFWLKQGSPTGEAGAAASAKNMRQSEVELLKETEDKLKVRSLD